LVISYKDIKAADIESIILKKLGIFILINMDNPILRGQINFSKISHNSSIKTFTIENVSLSIYSFKISFGSGMCAIILFHFSIAKFNISLVSVNEYFGHSKI
jgi:hypothetical protein